MNEIIETPATNSFIAELDAAIQKIKRDPKVRLEYVTFEMCMEERALERQIQLVKKFFAAGTPIKTIIQATGWGKQKVKKILDERPNENLDHESLMEINSDSIASANKNFSGIRAKIYARTYIYPSTLQTALFPKSKIKRESTPNTALELRPMSQKDLWR